MPGLPQWSPYQAQRIWDLNDNIKIHYSSAYSSMIINFTNFKPCCPVVQSTTRLDAFAFQPLIMTMVFFRGGEVLVLKVL